MKCSSEGPAVSVAVLPSVDAERVPHHSSVFFLGTIRTFLVAIFLLLGDVFFIP